MSDDALVLVEQLGKVRRLTLNRPEKSNSLSGPLLARLLAEIDAAADDLSTSVVILAGSGNGFCAGYDIAAPGQQDVWSDRIRLQRAARYLEAVWSCPLPVIAQVHGYALAGGADLALHCDLLMCSDDARVGYPPVRNLGVPPTNMWLYRLGPQMTKRLLFTGDSLTGAEAADLGLAIDAVPTERLADACLMLAQRIALVSRENLIGNKAVVNLGVDLQGRGILSRVAPVEDAVAHTAPAAQQFRAGVRANGLSSELRRRDAPFAPDPPGIVRRPSRDARE